MLKGSTMFALLLSLTACAQVGVESSAPPPREDPLERHSRESDNWQEFDGQLDRLYVARPGMRRPYDLPASPPDLQGAVEQEAWQLCQASRVTQLASLRAQEALNDVQHCKQAMQLAEQELIVAQARDHSAREVMSDSVLALQASVVCGDLENNKRSVLSLAESLPGYYQNLLRSLAESF